MREINRLRTLQMSVARHDDVSMLLRQSEQCILHRAKTDDDLVDLLAHVEAKVERDLIIAAACAMQFRARRTNPFGQRGLDVHMHIFQRLVPHESALGYFAFDLAQPARDHLELVSGENSSSGKSGGMRDGSGNVMAVKPSIERNRFAVTLSNLGRRG